MTFRLAGSVLASGSVLYENFIISNALDSHTSMMTFTMKGVTPVVGNDIKATYTTPNVFEFAGTILQIRTVVRPGFTTVLYECVATGYLWMMDRGQASGFGPLVTGRYNCGANTAVSDILARFTTGGFRVGYIPSSLGNITMNFDQVRVSEAITRIATAVRAYWEVTADRVVSIYNTYPDSTLPTLTNSSRLLDDLEYGQDLTQVRTISYYRGGGTTATAAVNVGGTSIPVANIAPFVSQRNSTYAVLVISGQNVMTVAAVSGYVPTTANVGLSGPGSIVLRDSSQVVYRIEQGDAVNLLASSQAVAGDFTAISTALGEGDGTVMQVMGDGIQWFDESFDRASSDVQLFKTTISDFNFTTLNREVRPGRLQPVNMTVPFVVNGSFLIQTVDITTRGVVTSANVVFYRRVSTSPWRLTMTNLLRGVEQM
jgi:hypothetical protein